MDFKEKNLELLDYYSHLYKKNPRSKYFVPLAEVHRSLDNLETASEVLEKGLKWHPNYFIGRALLSQIYYQRGHFTKAHIESQKVLEHDKNNLTALRIAMLSSAKLNKHEKAQSFAQAFLKHCPEDKEALYFLAEKSVPEYKLSFKKVTLLKNLLQKIQK
ncbi:MAG: hypothetical protein A2Z91_04215 [Deltaproteobacteria bacterium GWA2_38_16]|nr:MAG: hypothetical protein A2Z91_04215 [Deltaproteobacteria bacterium GWA2_38_16]OGQ01790.1 MAG: hypothetical protein A3D19_07965 [Deltaproteobacteria bacterium RIFCSPHIGHO2_02_FULL_38_15]OGQ30245.1 MAG: hypothetical protein A3A72_08335 [Deltaproteobacteria bacterium RIFCSPLOWO2_01_FULL_38_9]OGQ58890.1 MAG: hypothetical protein A3G92_07785 [Deltaproteobacteria bacterium RIFCSPLOWO2_12_FULL_38_8]HBQ21402.1 hypothetical protein [Deltaproteobacteria bacterium]